ncbi:MAG TPA: CpsB/CapC family capsule biosynthesis tyrosine phosphatase [Solirubrobacteraceae bacterium]|nr:CpsB/CapC family capsule biosynthesis tyrosine phosphatase [Solirubrobacteraceae bacterium]
MIDLHCHVLPGIDDGPQTIEESLAMAEVAARSGTRTLVATPHVNRRYANRASTILPLVEDLNRRIRDDGLELEVRPGAEVALLGAAALGDEELCRLRLGGGPWLLVEPPTAPVEDDVAELVMALAGRGHRVLLAHPERCPAFREDPGVLASLVGEGVLGSVTAASLRGHFGEDVARFALELLRSELIHNVASDAHHHEARPPTVLAELDRVGLGPLAEWFTARVPGAILEGTEIPQRPLLKAGLQTRSTWVRREPSGRERSVSGSPSPPPASLS